VVCSLFGVFGSSSSSRSEPGEDGQLLGFPAGRLYDAVGRSSGLGSPAAGNWLLKAYQIRTINKGLQVRPSEYRLVGRR
jgi:hypothetical protein